MKRGMKITFMLAAISFAMSSLANGEIVTYELPAAFEREYNYDDPTSSMAFDLGVSFTEISDVHIDWTGEIVGKETLNAGIIDYQFIATLYESDPYDYFARAYVQGGAGTYPNPEPFELQSSFTSADWAALLDGRSSIEIWFGATSHPLDSGSGLPGTGQLGSATLIVEGTVIPEPCSIFFLAIGSLVIRRVNCRVCHR